MSAALGKTLDDVRGGEGPVPVMLLLVEDNDIDACLVERLIRKMDGRMALVRVRNGEEALETVRGWASAGPTVAFIDLKMPRMDGLELLDELDRLRSPQPSGPVYMLTTSSNPADREAALAHARVSGYLVKPLNRQVLETAVALATAPPAPVSARRNDGRPLAGPPGSCT